MFEYSELYYFNNIFYESKHLQEYYNLVWSFQCNWSPIPLRTRVKIQEDIAQVNSMSNWELEEEAL